AMHTPVAAAAQAAQPAADPQALLDQLVQRFAVMVRGGLAEMKMVLKPDVLGKLAISIQVEDDLVTARFTAESHRVKHLLEAGLPQLKAALEAGGIKLDRAEVEVSPAVSQGAAGDTSRQHQPQAQAGAPRTGRSPAGWQQETMAGAQSAAVPRSPSLGWSGQIDFVV
ncbi:MAG: flagellar hook-length control protein FliK, partial [Syntrophomonadaceae bacterium]|nr:flagellar hook-length control protein FliK [Syntrophomonadaceae bacterium]